MDSASADRGGVARSLIIWAAALLAGILLPALVFKRWMTERPGR